MKLTNTEPLQIQCQGLHNTQNKIIYGHHIRQYIGVTVQENTAANRNIITKIRFEIKQKIALFSPYCYQLKLHITIWHSIESKIHFYFSQAHLTDLHAKKTVILYTSNKENL